MKKILLLLAAFSITTLTYAQQPTKKDTSAKQQKDALIKIASPASPKAQPAKPVKEVSPEIKDATADRDSAKSTFRQRTQENTKDINHYKRIENNNNTLKEQLKSAKKGKKTDKADAIQEKITANTDSLKELNLKMKSDEKEISKLEKDMDKAEKALKQVKDREAKEKAKGKK